ncbi:unnamed protein product [Cutaneotrichosporon oleaginosum]
MSSKHTRRVTRSSNAPARASNLPKRPQPKTPPRKRASTTPRSPTVSSTSTTRQRRVPIKEARRLCAGSKMPYHVHVVHPRQHRDGSWGLQYHIGRALVEHMVHYNVVDKRGWRKEVDAWLKSKPEMTEQQRKCQT